MNTIKEIIEYIDYLRTKKGLQDFTEIYNTKCYLEEEIRKTIKKCYSYGHAEPLTAYYDGADDNLICVAELLERLFGKK